LKKLDAKTAIKDYWYFVIIDLWPYAQEFSV